MIAIYPGNGTRYVKHVDNPVKDGRCITSIYYCNENWDMDKDGGGLRLYPETSATPMDIDPQADRLVFFWSDRRNQHEVLPVYRNRLVDGEFSDLPLFQFCHHNLVLRQEGEGGGCGKNASATEGQRSSACGPSQGERSSITSSFSLKT